MNNSIINLKYSLEKNDKSYFYLIPKADTHIHALLGSNRTVFNQFFPNIKISTFKESYDIKSLSDFIRDNIIDISNNRNGQLKLFECTIITAISDSITRIDISIDYRLCFEYSNINLFINDIVNLKNKYNSKILINYDLGISRNAFQKQHYSTIISLIKSKVFQGIDLYGDELSKKINHFKRIYNYAKRQKLTLKAHVGEFGTSKDILNAIKKLHLQVVQHGIAIVDDPKVMKYAKKHNIRFNVCPISNLKLKRINNIKQHPIKKMFDYGLLVTINTDDQLIFENSLFDEYKLLFDNNIFTIEELNQILLNSLS